MQKIPLKWLPPDAIKVASVHFARKCIHASSSAFEEGIVCIGRKAKTTAAVNVGKLGSIVQKTFVDGLSTPTL